jgi:hypothetical protein
MNTEFWFCTASLFALRAVAMGRGPTIGRTLTLLAAPIAIFAFYGPSWRLIPPLVALALVHASYLVLEAKLAAGPKAKAFTLAARLVSGLLVVVIAGFAFGPSSPIAFGPHTAALTAFVRSHSYLGARLTAVGAYHLWLYVTAGLYVSFEANLLVALVLNALRIEPRRPDAESGAGAPAGAPAGTDGADAPAGDDAPATDEKELDRGRVIGILERLLILAFTVGESVSAIGFILAAKGFARFRELDNKDFAEYVLVGTLLSASLGVAVGLIARSFAMV